MKACQFQQDREAKKMYKITRFYSDDRKPKTIKTGLTLKQAQKHCRDPKTRKEGIWFDGYDIEKR